SSASWGNPGYTFRTGRRYLCGSNSPRLALGAQHRLRLRRRRPPDFRHPQRRRRPYREPLLHQMVADSRYREAEAAAQRYIRIFGSQG
ncbi:MAG: hypothetical protein ACUVV3_09235, partial [Dehalococcoidia bacterium]